MKRNDEFFDSEEQAKRVFSSLLVFPTLFPLDFVVFFYFLLFLLRLYLAIGKKKRGVVCMCFALMNEG